MPLNLKNPISRAVIFDWIFFITSLSLGFIFPSFTNFTDSFEFSYWMLAALLFYILGAWLKHLPVFHRLYISNKQIKKIPAFLFIVIGHWIMFMLVEQFSEPAFRKLVDLPPINPERTDGETVLISGLVATFVTWLVFRSPAKSIAKKNFSVMFLFRREMLGDIFLVVSISVIGFLFWEKGVMTYLITKPMETLQEVWFSFVVLSISYILFYLPLRYLFLIEDFSNRQTWIRLMLIFGLLLVKDLFKVLNI